MGESFPRPVAIFAAGLVLGLTSACVAPGPNGFTGVGAVARDALPDAGLVRAPEVFRASGLAQWDGKRTARGIWVAHPKTDRARRVRIVNATTGAEIDGMLYRPDRDDSGDVVTVSSDAARALGLTADEPVLLSLFGLRPEGAVSARQRRATETRAQSELASHLARMEPNRLVQLAAAAMRGMGYATIFEPAGTPDALPWVRAFPRPDQGFALPAIRVLVRPAAAPAMTAAEVAAVQTRLIGSGDLGAIMSISGFASGAERGLTPGDAHVELVDLDGLLNIWLTHYEQLSAPDRALMPLQPVYFLAGG